MFKTFCLVGGSLPVNLVSIQVWIRDNLLRERPELFLSDANATKETIDVRPGILVLVRLHKYGTYCFCAKLVLFK